MQNDLIIENGILNKVVSKEKLKEITIPEGVKEISARVFENQNELKRVQLPDSLEIIREGAFYGCKNLKKIYLPKGIKIIEKDAFSKCYILEIYCQGRVKKGWIDQVKIEQVTESYISPEDEAFNFHRSSGSWSYTTYTRDVEVRTTWNPEQRPIHSMVRKEKYQLILSKTDSE